MQEVYKEWELPKRPPPLPHPPRTLLPFAATSAYHDSFSAHPAQPVYRLEAVTYKGGAILSTPDISAAKFLPVRHRCHVILVPGSQQEGATVQVCSK